MHVLVVIGTRPEAIKLASVVSAFRQQPGVTLRCCITSQHTDLLHPLLDFFHIPRDYDLDVMRPGQTLAGVTAMVVQGVADILQYWPCDLVVVQGDTTTAFAAGLAAFYARVPVAHVEAGLRSGDLAHPFPEEANRRFLDIFADYLFAPTEVARDYLLAEGRQASQIFVTGNTGIDALFLARDRLLKFGQARPSFLPVGEPVCLLTAHRRESFGPPLRDVFQAVVRLTELHSRLHVLAPLHPNPQVQNAARVLHDRPRIHVTEPLDYPDFVAAMMSADLILTDSGGVQEEAPALGKPVLVLRETTERQEGVEAGAVELVGTNPRRIVTRALALLNEKPGRFPRRLLYGDGQAAERILDVLTPVRSQPIRRAA